MAGFSLSISSQVGSNSSEKEGSDITAQEFASALPGALKISLPTEDGIQELQEWIAEMLTTVDDSNSSVDSDSRQLEISAAATVWLE